MAARYWVGGANTWNAAAGTKWAATSGGASGASAPTAADDVFLDAASGAVVVTLATGAACRSVNCAGFTGTLSHPSSTTLPIGDATAGAGNVAMLTSAGMTYTLGSGTTSLLSFISTAATVQTLTFGGRTWPMVTINGPGASYQAADAMIFNTSATFTLTAGTLDTNGQDCTWGGFNSNNSNTRAISLGASLISLVASWNISTTTGLTFNAGTSSITSISGNSTFNGGSLTYYNLSIGGSGGSQVLNGANTFNNLNFTGTNSGRVALAADQIVTGALSCASSASTNMSLVQSNLRTVQRMITAASIGTLQDHNFQDIMAAGPAVPWSTTNVGNLGGNSGITFQAAVTRYWVGGTGSWNNAAKWSTSSGGAGGASIPLCHDTAVFDTNSTTTGGQVLTINQECVPALDFRNAPNTPTIAQVITNGIIFVNGGLMYALGQTISGTTTLTPSGRVNTDQIITNGVTLTNPLDIQQPGSAIMLVDDLTTTNVIALNYGTFDTNSKNVTCTSFTSSTTNTRALDCGTTTWSLTSTAAANLWNVSTFTNMTASLADATIVISAASANSRGVLLGNFSYKAVTYTVAASTGPLVCTPSTIGATVQDFNFSDATNARTLTFASNSLLNVVNFNVSGGAGRLVTLNASSAGVRHNLNNLGGVISRNYLDIKDSNATGAGWYAGNNSVDTGNNVGWIFRDAQVLDGSGYANTQAFGAGVLRQLTILAGSGHANQQAFGAGSLRQVTYLQGSGYANSQAFGAGAVRQVVAMVGSGYANSQAFGAGSLSYITRLIGSGYLNETQFGAGAAVPVFVQSDDLIIVSYEDELIIQG